MVRQTHITTRTSGVKPRCLSCGEPLPTRRKKYCAIECRQKLRRTLNARTGLLKALNTRYATFYFTDAMIIMDVLPFHSKEIFSYILQRSNQRKPAEDYCRMANVLGNAWWAEKRRTNRNYLASKHILDQAQRNNTSVASVQPVLTRIPVVGGTALIQLQLGKADLDSTELPRLIKKAYREQAKKHHPDTGGTTAAFRKIHNAYQALIDWAESPTFIHRRGFPDKWFYDGERNRWVQPTPS